MDRISTPQMSVALLTERQPLTFKLDVEQLSTRRLVIVDFGSILELQVT